MMEELLTPKSPAPATILSLLLIITHCRYNSFSKTGAISKEEFLNTLKKISCQLEESIKCLQPEAEGTKEAYQAKLANKALKGIKELIFFSDFL